MPTLGFLGQAQYKREMIRRFQEELGELYYRVDSTILSIHCRYVQESV